MANKFLECSSAGTIATQSRQAYGTWTFDLYKGADANEPHIQFMNSDTVAWGSSDGYTVVFTTTERVGLYLSDTTNKFYTAASYIDNNTLYRMKVARLQSEGVFKDIDTLQTSDCVNADGVYSYTTFTSNGRYGFSATSDGSGIHIAGTADEISVVDTKKYLVEFDLKLNSGTAPIYLFNTALTGPSSKSDVLVAVNGRNSGVLTANDTGTFLLSFRNTSTATNYTVSGLTIRRIYDANTFAVFIKGGKYGADTWTLVSTAGGSGSNPVLDATYTTSQYTVLDLDAGDRITNFKFTPIVKQ